VHTLGDQKLRSGDEVMKTVFFVHKLALLIPCAAKLTTTPVHGSAQRTVSHASNHRAEAQVRLHTLHESRQ